MDLKRLVVFNYLRGHRPYNQLNQTLYTNCSLYSKAWAKYYIVLVEISIEQSLFLSFSKFVVLQINHVPYVWSKEYIVIFFYCWTLSRDLFLFWFLSLFPFDLDWFNVLEIAWFCLVVFQNKFITYKFCRYKYYVVSWGLFYLSLTKVIVFLVKS